MSLKRSNLALLGLASLGLGAGAALGADPVKPDLQTQVDALTAQVQELKAAQNQSPPPVAATTQQGTAGLTGGWNNDTKQFFIGSTDGKFYFHPGVIFQPRYDAEYRRSPDRWTNGFELRWC